MAHVARPYTLALGLARTGWPAASLFFACDPRSQWMLNRAPMTVISLPAQPSEVFLDALEHEKPLYSAETLAAYVEQDRKLINSVKPDLIVGDFRLSLSVSARLEHVPYAAISNFHWSPYSLQPLPHTFDKLASMAGTSFTQSLFNLVFPIGSYIHSRPMNLTRRRYGLQGSDFNLQQCYTDADYVLYEDIPGWFPSKPIPAAHQFLGPIVFTPPARYPDWWETWPENKPVIYVTLGSSGDMRILDALIPALGTLNASVLFATAGRAEKRKYPKNFYTSDFLPGLDCAKRSDLVIANGGSGTTKQALLAGKPVLSLVTNMDQELVATPIGKRGAGICLKRAFITKESVGGAIEKIIQNKNFRTQAEKISQEFQAWDSLELFRHFLQRLNK